MRLLFEYAINKNGKIKDSRDLPDGLILNVFQEEKSEAENIEIRYIHIKDEFEMSELMSEKRLKPLVSLFIRPRRFEN